MEAASRPGQESVTVATGANAVGSRPRRVTDASGHDEPGFAGEEMGAIVGSHAVRVIPATEDDNGNPLPNPVQLPAKYNQNSELAADVKADTNEREIALTSQR